LRKADRGIGIAAQLHHVSGYLQQFAKDFSSKTACNGNVLPECYMACIPRGRLHIRTDLADILVEAREKIARQNE
jgi:hypothetical protein